jgi:hypothetical protein
MKSTHDPRTMRFLMVLLTLAVVASCSGRSSHAQVMSSPTQVSSVPRAIHISQHGIGCMSYEYPNRVGPPSYSVRDIGKADVPELSRNKLNIIRRIEHYISPIYLRFTLIPDARLTDHFIVFNATNGPCLRAAPGYNVLNFTWSNGFYQPGENPFVVTGVPGDMAPTPGPWLRSPHP